MREERAGAYANRLRPIGRRVGGAGPIDRRLTTVKAVKRRVGGITSKASWRIPSSPACEWTVFSKIPGRISGCAFLDVQHLDPKHTSRLRGILARATAMPVVEARHGMAVEADHLYGIPPDRALLLFRPLALEERRTRAIGVIPPNTVGPTAGGNRGNPHRRGETDGGR